MDPLEVVVDARPEVLDVFGRNPVGVLVCFEERLLLGFLAGAEDPRKVFLVGAELRDPLVDGGYLLLVRDGVQVLLRLGYGGLVFFVDPSDAFPPNPLLLLRRRFEPQLRLDELILVLPLGGDLLHRLLLGVEVAHLFVDLGVFD